jgi:WD40 repeat protein
VLGLDVLPQCGVVWLRHAGLLAYAAGSNLVLLELASKRHSLLVHHTQPVGALAASPDGRLLATASAGPEAAGGCADVAVWGVDARRLLALLRQHTVAVTALAFSPDEAWLVSGDAGGRLVVWDLGSGQAAAVGATPEVHSDPLLTVL